MGPAETENMVSQICLCLAVFKIVIYVVLGTSPRYSLVTDEDIKKPTKPNLWL